MATIFWLALAGYLLVGLGDLIAVGMEQQRRGTVAAAVVCVIALVFALSWPWRRLREAVGG